MESPKRSQSYMNMKWIEKYCRIASGPERGAWVRLTPEEFAILRRI